MRELFSRRQAREKGELSDVYVYDVMPEAFRNQFCHIIQDFYDFLRKKSYTASDIDNVFEELIIKPIAVRLGLLNLPRDHYDNSLGVIKNFIRRSKDQDCIDAIDYVLHVFEDISTQIYGAKEQINDIINKANYWLKYNSLGYEFVNDELIRKSNEVIHQQVVLPAFRLIHDPRFAGANEEMRNAYELRRTKNNEAAIVEANKAFESVMKGICDIMQYQYDPNYAASKLLGVLKSNNYFPTYLQSHLDAVNASIESGLPVVRNKTAGHGQGAQPRSVPDEYVDYALHILSTNLVFLIGLLPK